MFAATFDQMAGLAKKIISGSLDQLIMRRNYAAARTALQAGYLPEGLNNYEGMHVADTTSFPTA